MQIVYWAHSYRDEDARLNQHFGVLIERAANMIINFDPPSKSVNDSKLSQNLRACDGMVAVLTWRDRGPSQFILYEIALALRARKPLVVFMDDRLSHDVIPPWILQRRFSHRTYFRQFREHAHALGELKSYMGDPPPARNERSSGQRACGIVGLASLDKEHQNIAFQFLQTRGYRTIELEKIDAVNPLMFDKWDYLAHLHLVLQFVDARSQRSVYWGGALVAAGMPLITITLNPDYLFSDSFPREFQPRLANVAGAQPLEEVLKLEFDLYEQDFLKAEDVAEIERYTQMQVAAGWLRGRYEASTRERFTEVIMGDKYEGNRGVVVGPHAHVHDVTQIWNELENKVDLSQIANELRQLRERLERDAVDAKEKLAAAAIAAAEESARKQDGPTVLQHLRTAGHWASTVAAGLHLVHLPIAFKAALASLGA